MRCTACGSAEVELDRETQALECDDCGFESPVGGDRPVAGPFRSVTTDSLEE